MRKKLLWFALVLCVLCATQAASVQACHKSATLVSTGDGDRVIETGELIVWNMEIYIRNTGQFGTWGETWTDVIVKDQLAAELDVVAYNTDKGTVVFLQKRGRMGKWYLIWDIGTLAPDEGATLAFTVCTKLNPGGNLEYTSPGDYMLNSGAVLKFKVDRTKYSLEMPGIPIVVLPKS